MAVLDQIEISSMNLTVNQIHSKYQKGEIFTNNEIQRAEVWDNKRKSLFIHTLLRGFPYPNLFVNKYDKDVENHGKTKNISVIDIIDGKQRFLAIAKYRAGDYKLSSDTPSVSVDGETVEIAGLTYDELPGEIREVLGGTKIQFTSFSNVSDEDVAEAFYRLNNMIPLSAIEKALSRASGFRSYSVLMQHPFFTEFMTTAQRNKMAQKPIIIKTLGLLYMETPSLDSRFVNKFISETAIDDEKIQRVTEIFDKYSDIYSEIPTTEKKIAKRLTGKGYIPFVSYFLNSHLGDDTGNLVKFLCHFFSGADRATISEKYNEASGGSGTGKTDKVKARMEALEEEYTNWAG